MKQHFSRALDHSAFFVRLCVAVVILVGCFGNVYAQSGSSCGSAVNISLSTSSSTCLSSTITQNSIYAWYKFTAIQTVTNFAIAYDPSQNGLIGAVHVYTGSCNALTEIGATVDAHQDSVKLFLNILSIGQTYFLRLDKYNNSCIGCPTTSSVSFTICSSPAEQLPFQVTGQDVKFDGQIGIGKTPTAPLDVLGNAKISGNLQAVGDGTFSGSLYTGAISVSNLSTGSGLQEVYVDQSGNLKTIGSGGGGSTQLLCGTALNWALGGNSIGSYVNSNPPPAAGTCDNFDFVLKAYSTPYVWLKTDGKLGIGTSSPTALLDVKTSGNSTAFSVNDGTNSLFSIDPNGSTSIFDKDAVLSNPLLTMTHSSGSTLKFMANGPGDISASTSISLHYGAINASDNFSIYQGVPGSGIKHFFMNLNGESYFRSTGGQLNLPAFIVRYNTLPDGTGSESDLLSVNNNGSTTITDLDQNSFNPVLTLVHSGGSTLQFMANGAGDIASSSDIRPHYQTSNGDFSVFQGTPGQGILHFSVAGDRGLTTVRSTGGATTDDAFVIAYDPNMNQTGGQSVFSVKNNGSVTITGDPSSSAPAFSVVGSNGKGFSVQNLGLTNIGLRVPDYTKFPNTMLTVDGSVVVAQDIWVADGPTGGWADYVFAANYKLKPLSEVEKYIQANKHLPNVPSEEQLKDGHNIGKLQVTQMEKIEELYLYVLEMNKRVEALEKENQELKNRIGKKR